MLCYLGFDEVITPAPDDNQNPENNLPETPGNVILSQESLFFRTMNWILSNRLISLRPMELAFTDSTAFQKLIGIGYINHADTPYKIEKAIEMDFFALLYRHGYVGLLLFYTPIVLLGIYLFLFFCRNLKKCFADLSFCTELYSILIALGISF